MPDTYEDTLRAAAATVHTSQHFGDYQGTWLALVTYNGVTGWVHGSFGSCSGCDSLQATFQDDYQLRDGQYEFWCDCQGRDAGPDARADWEKARAEYAQRVADFGRSYLTDLLTQQEAEAMPAKDMEWDSEAPRVLAFIRANAIGVAGAGAAAGS